MPLCPQWSRLNSVVRESALTPSLGHNYKFQSAAFAAIGIAARVTTALRLVVTRARRNDLTVSAFGTADTRRMSSTSEKI